MTLQVHKCKRGSFAQVSSDGRVLSSPYMRGGLLIKPFHTGILGNGTAGYGVGRHLLGAVHKWRHNWRGRGGVSQKMTKDDMMTMSKISVPISNVHFFSHLLPSFGLCLVVPKDRMYTDTRGGRKYWTWGPSWQRAFNYGQGPNISSQSTDTWGGGEVAEENDDVIYEQPLIGGWEAFFIWAEQMEHTAAPFSHTLHCKTQPDRVQCKFFIHHISFPMCARNIVGVIPSEFVDQYWT